MENAEIDREFGRGWQMTSG